MGIEALFQRCLTRLRSHLWLTLALTLAGTLTALAESLIKFAFWLDHGLIDAVIYRLPRNVLVTFLSSMVLVLGLRLCIDKGSDLVRRPGRFVLIMLAGGTLVTVFAQAVSIWSGLSDSPSLSEVPADEWLDFWLQAMLWGGLFGWLYLLSLQHLEDQQTLGMLLGRRSLLARQLAHTRLGAARAQIDPAMVAQVLGQVHARYPLDPRAAAGMLDHLVDYLRLAMNRVHDLNPTLAAEIALIQAWLALYQAEHNIEAALVQRIGPPLPSARPNPAGPLFLVTRMLLEQARLAGAAGAQLVLAGHENQLRIELLPGPIGLDQAALAAALAEVLPATSDALQCFIEPEGNRYVVQHVFQ